MRKDIKAKWEIADAALINYGPGLSNTFDREMMYMKHENAQDTDNFL
jgi:hypothetical protein